MHMACDFIGWCALNPPEQAAWAQALLSALGIGIAIWIPARAARRDRKRQTNAVLGLVEEVHAEMQDALRRLDPAVTPGPVVMGSEPGVHPWAIAQNLDTIERLVAALESVPLYSLPIEGMARSVVRLVPLAHRFVSEGRSLQEQTAVSSSYVDYKKNLLEATLGRFASEKHVAKMLALRVIERVWRKQLP
jgi:hypothetical protein